MLLVMLAGMALSVAWVHRNLLFEQHAANNDAQASQALSAAEAGLAWAQTQLNATQIVGAACNPRQQLIDHTTATPAPLTCQHGQAGWACQCSNTLSLQTLPESSQPAFSVRMQPLGGAHKMRITAQACAKVQATCRQNPGAEVRQTLALAGGLQQRPHTTLTALGSIDGVAPLEPPGKQPASFQAPTLGANTARLTGLSPEQLFMTLFGIDKKTWSEQPALLSLDCKRSCANALSKLFRNHPGAMVHLPQLRLEGPITLGSPEHPVLLVVDEEAHIQGSVTLFGMLYARRISSNSTHGHLLVEGALVSESDITLGPSAQTIDRPSLLQRLMNTTGSYVRVPGTWSDL
jgi:hypothetical protein